MDRQQSAKLCIPVRIRSSSLGALSGCASEIVLENIQRLGHDGVSDARCLSAPSLTCAPLTSYASLAQLVERRCEVPDA